MKLHVGSGKYSLPGFTNVDIRPLPNVDIVGDFREMKFENVDEICARHILEHFGRDESRSVLALWYAWLSPGGTITVEVPDLEGICSQFEKDRVWMERHAYGSQEEEWAFHRSGWWEEKAYTEFSGIGFSEVKVSHSKSRVLRNGGMERHLMPNIIITARK